MRLLAFGTIACLVTAALAAAGETIPRPRQKPVRPQTATVAAEWPTQDSGWSSAAVKEGRANCGQLLKGLDITFERLAPIGGENQCGAPAPIAVSSVAGVGLEPPATVNCDMAYALHQWIKGSVQPAARRHLKTRVATIHNASSYVCRGRNGLRGGKLSEHGKANALDMSGFTFATSGAVAIGKGWGGLLHSIGLSRRGSFLGQIRDDACIHFATVLGPGSDSYHGDHFHVDAIRRKSGYRICK